MEREVEEIISSLQNRAVQFVRLAGNSLIIYCECEPEDLKQGYSIWLEPTWHLRNNVGVITGSRAAQTEDEKEHLRISEHFNQLYSKQIKRLAIEPITNDIEIEIEEGFMLRTFVSDPGDEETWHIRDHYNGIRIIGNPKAIEVTKEID